MPDPTHDQALAAFDALMVDHKHADGGECALCMCVRQYIAAAAREGIKLNAILEAIDERESHNIAEAPINSPAFGYSDGALAIVKEIREALKEGT